jgi:hypothetical protein
MNKRTQILKKITCDKSQITEGEISPINKTPLEVNTSIPSNTSAFKDICLQELLTEQINAIAEQLKVHEQHLRLWLNCFLGVPILNQLSLLRLIQSYGLDPFLEEVDLVQYEDQSWQAVITTQGYARLINACPQFKGIYYTYSEPDTNGVADWIECAIYRTDRDGPITAREYYVEAKRDGAVWQRMPRRMLRNRAFQQCAKLALGI